MSVSLLGHSSIIYREELLVVRYAIDNKIIQCVLMSCFLGVFICMA